MTASTPPSQDVYILGAGFSKWVAPEMPLTSEIGEHLRTRGGPEHSDIVDLVDRFGGFEAALSFLAAPPPFVDALKRFEYVARYRALAKFCGKHIADNEETVRESTRHKGVPLSLARLLEHWIQTQSDVLTLNYDTLIEAAYVGESNTSGSQRELYPADFRPIYPGGNRTIPQPRPFSLYKLHGSLNWYTYLDDPNADIYNAPISRWGRSDTISDDVRLDMDRFVVPPSFSKSSFLSRRPIQYLWRDAASRLLGAKRIICIGYSLPPEDTDMRSLLRWTVGEKENTRATTRIVVVNTDHNAMARYEELFVGCDVRPMIDDVDNWMASEGLIVQKD